MALVNTQPVLPVTVTTGEARYPSLEELLRPLEEQCQRVLAIEATALAEKAGTVQAMNVVMLGALSGYIPLSEKHIIQALERVVPPGTWRAIRGPSYWEKLK